MQAKIAISRRLRSTPWTSRLFEQGVKGFTVYNHMLLPTEFGSLEADYWHLCEHVQVWDVGAERQVEITGPDADRLIQWMTPRDISNVELGQCVYLPLADEQGKLINDPVGLKLDDQRWWLSVADSDVWLWAKGLAQGAGFDVSVSEPAVWPLAVQGPKAETLMARVFGDDVADIRFFRFKYLEFKGHPLLVARSGWSKQGGFEVYVDDVDIGHALFDELFVRGQDLNVGPGCPNLIERIESGLLSFGNEMDFNHSPLEAGLERFLHLDANIESLSLNALREERDVGQKKQLYGLAIEALDGPLVIQDQPFDAVAQAHSNFIGSQVWSPRYAHQLAIAMLDTNLVKGSHIDVKLADGRRTSAMLADLPFDFPALGISSRE